MYEEDYEQKFIVMERSFYKYKMEIIMKLVSKKAMIM